jgi:hypothetical protein
LSTLRIRSMEYRKKIIEIRVNRESKMPFLI